MAEPVKMKQIDGRQYYTESFKKYVVKEVESGRITKEGAKHKYKIGGNSLVLNWCRKYGKHHKYKERGKKVSIDSSTKIYNKRIKELESALSESRLRTLYLETVVDIVEERTGVNIEKKYEELLLDNSKVNQQK